MVEIRPILVNVLNCFSKTIPTNKLCLEFNDPACFKIYIQLR